MVDEHTDHVGDFVGLDERCRQLGGAEANIVQRRTWAAVPGPFHQLMQCQALRYAGQCSNLGCTPAMAGDSPPAVLAGDASAGAQYRDQGVVQHCAACHGTETGSGLFVGTLIAECSLNRPGFPGD